MGNGASIESVSASLSHLESITMDPSMILGEFQQDITMRTQRAAQSSSGNNLLIKPSIPNQDAIPFLVSSSIEAPSGLQIQDAGDPQEESQLREGVLEVLEMLNPLALFRSTFIDDDDELAPPAETLAEFAPTSGYINFLLIIIYIHIKPK